MKFNSSSSTADWLMAHSLDGHELDMEISPLTGDLDASIDELYRSERLVAAATAARVHIREHVAMLIGDGGAYRDGDKMHRGSRRKAKRIVTPGSEDALLGWLGADLARAVPARAVRITDVRGIAEDRYRRTVSMPEAMASGFGDSVERHVATIESTFYTWDEDPEEEPSWQLTTVPVHKAPKFLQKLEPGERYQPPEREGT